MIFELEERQEYQQFIEELTPLERGIYADMIMRSLRGSWRKPRRRTFLLLWLGRRGDMEIYDSEWLENSADEYFKQIGKGNADGRRWRSYYEEKEVDLTTLSERKVRELASHIPNDMTWDDHRINKVFSND